MVSQPSFQLVWEDRAEAALSEILAVISDDNPSAAERLLETVLERTRLLASVPRIGARYGAMLEWEVRQFVVGRYRIFYLIDDSGQRISILNVWHGSRRDPSPDDLGL